MKERILILVLLFAGVFALSAADEAERMKFADGLYARGMYELAVKEYEGLLGEFPQSKQVDVVLFRLAESLRQTGKVAEADKHFRDIYIKHAKSKYRDRAGLRRADLHRQSGRLDNAATLYTLLIESSSSSDMRAASLYYLGEIHMETKKTADAVKVFEQVRTKYPKSEFSAYALLKLGFIYSSQKNNINKSYEAYKVVVSKPPTARMGAEAWFQMAELYYSQKDYNRSADAYRQLLSKYPDDKRSQEAKVQAAWSQYHARRYADALKLAEAGLTDKSDGADSTHGAEWLYLKANCQRQLLRNDDAVKTYGKLLAEHPGSTFASSARYERALSSYRAGKYQIAIDAAEGINVLPSDDARMEGLRKDVYWLLAESYAALNKDDDAVQYYRMISADFPKSDVACDATYRLAYHLQARKNFLEAARHYTVVGLNFPKSELAPRALYASGLCRVQAGKDDDAVRDWTKFLEQYPKHALVEETIYRKAVSEVRMGEGDTAIKTLGRLSTSFPKSTFAGEAHYWRGALYKDLNKLEDAENEFRQALKVSVSKELEMETRFYLAVVLHKRGKTDESANIFVSLLGSSAADKFTPTLLEWLAGYWSVKKDYKKAKQCAEVMLSKFTEKATQQIALAILGRCYLAENNKPKAEEVLEKAVNIDVETEYAPEMALRLGEIKLASGKNAQAMKYFEKAANYNVGANDSGVRAHAYAGLAKASQKKGDMDAASKYYMSVAILYDDEKLVSECLYEAVKVFLKQGKSDDADKAVTELSRRYPKSPYIGQLKGQK